MENIINAKTEYVIQADKGDHDWHDYSKRTADNESIGRSDLFFIHKNHSSERHRLVRRITIDVELAYKEKTS